jgi:hypothetical protein
MKTVTLEMPEDVYERAQRRARELGVTLSGFVGDLLRPISEEAESEARSDRLSEQLADLAAECRSANWDGQGAAPVSDATLRYAQLLARALPAGGREPSVGVEADGHLTFEWYRDPHWLLSVSVGPHADLYFAGLFGTSDVRGHEVFQDTVPSLLRELIRKANAS